VVDGQLEELNEEFFKNYIIQFQPEVVGISACTPTFSSALKVSGLIKKILPSVKVGLGGIHPTLFPQATLEKKEVDFVIRGEGELTFWEYIKTTTQKENLRKIKGLSYKFREKIIHNPPRDPIVDLNFLPFPARHLLPRRKYVETIITSRGCPFNCIFCSVQQAMGRKYRVREALNVVDEIGTFIEDGIKFFFVLDDNFCVQKKRVIAICRLMIERGYHRQIEWGCETRADLVDEEMLALMKEAGCLRIFFGLETHSQKLLDQLNKKMKIEQNEKAVKLAQKIGLEVRGSFILGIPGETKEETIKTIKYAKSLKLTEAKFALATPYPGTELFKIAQAEGVEIKEKDWEKLSTVIGFSKYQPLYVPQGRTKKELVKLQRRAYLEFYLQFYQLKRLFKEEIKSFHSLWKFISIFCDLIFKMFKKRGNNDG
jgi:radical SAM superfamily enzyme YgiQ (UPF0313 family)